MITALKLTNPVLSGFKKLYTWTSAATETAVKAARIAKNTFKSPFVHMR